MYASSSLPDDQLLDVARGMTPEERAELLAASVGARANRRHKPGRSWERTGYRFDVLRDYGAFRDLQRHRPLTIEWQALGTGTATRSLPRSTRPACAATGRRARGQRDHGAGAERGRPRGRRAVRGEHGLPDPLRDADERARGDAPDGAALAAAGTSHLPARRPGGCTPRSRGCTRRSARRSPISATEDVDLERLEAERRTEAKRNARVGRAVGREARSGRRIDEAGGAKVRIINRAGGMRMWYAYLRVSRSAGQPVVEIRQRPWIGLVITACFAGIFASMLIGDDEPAQRQIAWRILAFAVLIAVVIYVRGQGWARAGPDGLTIRSPMRRTPWTFPWSEVDEVHVTTERGFRDHFLSISVLSSGPDPMAGTVRVIRPLSVRRSRLLALVLLATSHRYGARGLYVGEQAGWGWRGPGRRRPLERDDRYFRPRTPPPAEGRESHQR